MYSKTEKAIALYRFVEELSKMRQKVILNVSGYSWTQRVSDIPLYKECVKINFRDRVDEESYDGETTLLSVSNPSFQKCPDLPKSLSSWIHPQWDKYDKKVLLKMQEDDWKYDSYDNLFEAYHADDFEKEEHEEYFFDKEKRVEDYNEWIEKRNHWQEEQTLIKSVRDLFAGLYQIHLDLERESETLELIVANGIFMDREDSKIYHPILTKRVKTSFNADRNIMSIEETDADPELYSTMFRNINELDHNKIADINADVKTNSYHPLDRNETPQFFERSIHLLNADSVYGGEEIPGDWKENARFLIYSSPIYIVRKKIDGTAKAASSIIENITETDIIPMHISDIVDGGIIEVNEDDSGESFEERLASVGGESVDILLSKEANREQLEIAKRIEQYNAVIVQGPPGTGKTHTIANLLGHFLAQGKNVLVTSHTKKALSVLKEKVPEGIRNLCVSVLEDSNKDMEKSIDGITDYMAQNTSRMIKTRMDQLAEERAGIINQLSDNRRKILSILKKEYQSIVLFGKSYSPVQSVKIINEHKEEISFIPGNVSLYSPLPLSQDEIAWLYRSNELLNPEDEKEIESNLPNPADLMSSVDYAETIKRAVGNRKAIQNIADTHKWTVSTNYKKQEISFTINGKLSQVRFPSYESLDELSDFVNKQSSFFPWMKQAIVDGKRGGAYKNRWDLLISSISSTYQISQQVLSETFTNQVQFKGTMEYEEIETILLGLKDHFNQKGKVTKIYLSLHKPVKQLLDEVKVNGKELCNSEQCDIVLHVLTLQKSRKECAAYWDSLIASNGEKTFNELDMEPESVAIKWVPLIQRYLSWSEQSLPELKSLVKASGLDYEQVFLPDNVLSEADTFEYMMNSMRETLVPMIDICRYALANAENTKELRQLYSLVANSKYVDSQICIKLADAIKGYHIKEYSHWRQQLELTYGKTALLERRKDSIEKLKNVAPAWANAIQRREGIHGKDVFLGDINQIWVYKQLNGIIDEMLKESLNTLQERGEQLSKDYRRITAEYAEKKAWFHLLSLTERDIDLKQALQGWKLTVKKIGKGTGKKAPLYRAYAKELMGKCQTAVPAWIMPIGKALESLDPKVNRFDVIIIDEASQADVSALAVAYMAKKLIIVGDDKQVSPMAIGVETDKQIALQNMYIKNVIPNYHLFEATSSIYDIAATTFPPLMLREHFRCVPDIIGFSNMLSYDNKIKPLRDAGSSKLLPAVINYRVKDGHREINLNIKEAEKTVALIKACIEQEAYKGKTIGVISLLKEEQALYVQKLLNEHIDRKEIEERRILCGISAHFQGDERDVIFLNMVDSNEQNGPLALQGFGVMDAQRKRYNVAVSRAKDQLWVVNSLDADNDLKPGDLRKQLLDYCNDPKAFDILNEQAKQQAESPFEEAVASALLAKGYHIEQQCPVGAYRIDMVVICGKEKIAIECDGDRYHSSEDQVRADMERQTILERAGWRFIRIRGSQYYRNPEKTMEWVVKELEKQRIYPESTIATENPEIRSELFQIIERRSCQILVEEFGYPETIIEPEEIEEEDDQDEGSEAVILFDGGSDKEDEGSVSIHRKSITQSPEVTEEADVTPKDLVSDHEEPEYEQLTFPNTEVAVEVPVKKHVQINTALKENRLDSDAVKNKLRSGDVQLMIDSGLHTKKEILQMYPWLTSAYLEKHFDLSRIRENKKND